MSEQFWKLAQSSAPRVFWIALTQKWNIKKNPTKPGDISADEYALVLRAGAYLCFNVYHTFSITISIVCQKLKIPWQIIFDTDKSACLGEK